MAEAEQEARWPGALWQLLGEELKQAAASPDDEPLTTNRFWQLLEIEYALRALRHQARKRVAKRLSGGCDFHEQSVRSAEAPASAAGLPKTNVDALQTWEQCLAEIASTLKRRLSKHEAALQPPARLLPARLAAAWGLTEACSQSVGLGRSGVSRGGLRQGRRKDAEGPGGGTHTRARLLHGGGVAGRVPNVLHDGGDGDDQERRPESHALRNWPAARPPCQTVRSPPRSPGAPRRGRAQGRRLRPLCAQVPPLARPLRHHIARGGGFLGGRAIAHQGRLVDVPPWFGSSVAAARGLCARGVGSKRTSGLQRHHLHCW